MSLFFNLREMVEMSYGKVPLDIRVEGGEQGFPHKHLKVLMPTKGFQVIELHRDKKILDRHVNGIKRQFWVRLIDDNGALRRLSIRQDPSGFRMVLPLN